MGTVPSFPKRDPASPEFWELRYREGFVPWDAGAVPQRLREFVARERAPGRVLVPGCGSGYEVRFFAEHAWEVEGIDFSAAAIEAARPVLGPHAGRVRLADFFATGLEGPYALIYERAFLCALPPSRWQDWARRAAELLAPAGRIAGFFYFDADAQRGPPFALRSQSELDALLASAFERVEDLDAPDSIPVFAGKERWQVWVRGQTP